MTLVIMAAGMGSRYGGLKQIDPLGPNGEFIVDYSVYDAIKAGFDKVVFIIKEENYEIFKNTISSRIKGIKIEYVFQKITNIPNGYSLPKDRTKPLGTAHAVLSCLGTVNDNFAVINSDDFYGYDSFKKLADFLRSAKSDDKNHYCMAGFVLENTITDNGSVSRGVCETDKDGYLTSIVEKTKIQRLDGKIKYLENEQWNDIAEHTTVSMNCWGFTPEFFDTLSEEFVNFFETNKNDLSKCEFFLPFVVKDSMDAGKCDVKVLNTSSKWYGVTYKEDRQNVVDCLKNMINNGIYPENLWNK